MTRKTNAQKRADRKSDHDEHKRKNEVARAERDHAERVRAIDDWKRMLRFGVWHAVTRLALGPKAIKEITPLALKRIRSEPFVSDARKAFNGSPDSFNVNELLQLASICHEAGKRLTAEELEANTQAQEAATRRPGLKRTLAVVRKKKLTPEETEAAKAQLFALIEEAKGVFPAPTEQVHSKDAKRWSA